MPIDQEHIVIIVPSALIIAGIFLAGYRIKKARRPD